MERGFAIKPYRLACMTKTAAKIVELLTAVTPVAYTNEEAKVVLDLVSDIISKGCEPCD